MHLVQMMKDQPILLPKTVSPSCRSFLEQLLQKNPLERLTWPTLLHHEFVRNRVYTTDRNRDNDTSSELDDIVSPLHTMRINEELHTNDSSTSENSLTSAGNT